MLERINNLRLQWKLSLAFLMMAPLIAAAGGTGLVFISRINTSVDSVARVSMPIVQEATALVAEIDRMRLALADALSRQTLDQVWAAQNAVDNHAAAMADGFQSIRELSDQGGVAIDVTEAEALSKTSTEQAKELVASLNSAVEARGQLRTRFDAFEALIGQVTAAATALSSQSEALMNSRENMSRSIIRSHAASVSELEGILSGTFSETYPILRNAYGLQAFVTGLRETARVHLAANDLVTAEIQEQNFVKLMKSAKDRQKKLQANASSEIAKDTQQIGAKLEEIERLVLGEKGLFATHRAAVTADLRAEVLNALVRQNL
ncbi:MAG TPA: MCP four helix bundle domain-containing protein, partial [Candidatus Polarisedimenticolia bacterium]|nr:MCP four helix bundle domain-containing protein [Candidatus Polarisedimenticolia bacterium]